MGYLLINGDSRRLPIDLAAVDAICSDPPYGMVWDPDSRRYSGGQTENNRKLQQLQGKVQGHAWKPIHGDNLPFDPTPWIAAPKVILWGTNHFGRLLPLGTTLVWIKRRDELFGTFLSDAEIGWMKGGYGVYCFRKQFPPPSRMFEANGQVAHPNQKPIALMRWCIRLLKLPPSSLILDPYMGVGTTIIAALAEGHRAIGIEIDPGYCAIARRRLEHPHAAVPRPGKAEWHPLFGDTP